MKNFVFLCTLLFSMLLISSCVKLEPKEPKEPSKPHFKCRAITGPFGSKITEQCFNLGEFESASDAKGSCEAQIRDWIDKNPPGGGVLYEVSAGSC